ncbi:MAG TPA: flagellar assembly protein FliH [Gammaproteobacteria bacterium]|nr:flagellar assembly protein FliH [Gammaproteobacteria bacterium]
MNLSNHLMDRATADSDVSVWDLPIVSEGEAASVATDPKTLLPTAEDIETIQRQAYQEAYDEAYEKAKSEAYAEGKAEGKKNGYEAGKEEGYAHGLGEGKAVIEEKSRQLSALISMLTTPLAKLDDEVEAELMALVMLVARHIIRRELKQNPSHVIAAIRQAVNILPVGTQNIILFLHPDDAELVRESLSFRDEDEQRWKIIEDPMLTRGGCKVETKNSRIDASVESQINSVVAQVLGSERGDDHAVSPDKP